MIEEEVSKKKNLVYVQACEVVQFKRRRSNTGDFVFRKASLPERATSSLLFGDILYLSGYNCLGSGFINETHCLSQR